MICNEWVRFVPGMQGWLTIREFINITFHINRLKEKNSITSSKAENAFDKNQTPVSVKKKHTHSNK